MTDNLSLEAFHLPTANGWRFCLFHHRSTVEGKCRGAILYVHPFAEEMNCARRVAAAQARAFAAEGFAVLQLDLAGCGDSEGDFLEATWPMWCDDLRAAIDWLAKRVDAPLWLWGLRGGCLLASAVARQSDREFNFLFWQPSVSGSKLLRQFLRLKVAAGLFSGRGPTSVELLLADLGSGRAVEVAGYSVSPELTDGLGTTTLEPPARVGRLIVVETNASRDPLNPSPAVADVLENWRKSGARLTMLTLRSPDFWSKIDRIDASALIATTSEALAVAAR